MLHSGVDLIPPGQHLSPRWRADRLRVKALQVHTMRRSGQCIHMWRAHLVGVALVVQAPVVVPLLVVATDTQHHHRGVAGAVQVSRLLSDHCRRCAQWLSTCQPGGRTKSSIRIHMTFGRGCAAWAAAAAAANITRSSNVVVIILPGPHAAHALVQRLGRWSTLAASKTARKPRASSSGGAS
jgi:hypothetical protein